MLILSFGLFTVSQLGTNPAELIVYDSFEIMSEEDRIEEEFLREMAVYYLEESDDIWDTYALLNDSELFNEKWENQ